MKNKMFALLALLCGVMLSACGSNYSYESVKGDPTGARIYTLDNGLKVYMAPNSEEPRIQTYIAIKVGGKNDPSETTGMAHYFEHLMFKGTHQFGTSDYEAEKPLLDEIERLFEVYRKTEDEAERKAIYKVIDSISYEASKIAIPNEYDKLMAAIGSDGTNAYTGYDQTVYVENIPSNQVENWARIQGDRFKNATVRGFHTELETIYEEKNMSLTQDSRKVSEAMLRSLFPNHPYGQQTILGSQEHLKNPSITNVKAYHANWYVPNNMAVCVSGDFDPEVMIETIDRYFGDMVPNPNLKYLDVPELEPLKEVVRTDIYGLDAENVLLAWRLGGYTSEDALIGDIASGIINNGYAGLIDLNINQQQKALSASGGTEFLADYGIFELAGRPKTGQTLEEVAELLLAELDKLRKGEWDESLIEATVNQAKIRQERYLDSNDGRADQFVTSFINGSTWEDEVNYIERLSKITKEDVIAWANEKLGDNSYAIVYKRRGVDEGELKIAKPAITPIATNRDAVSPFLAEIQNTPVKEIEPVFIDFEKDLSRFNIKNDIEVLYKENTSTDLFELSFVFETGSFHDPLFSTAVSYFDYTGTTDQTPEQLAAELYRLACNVRVSVGGNRTRVNISGLQENMVEAIRFAENWLANCVGDEAVLEGLKADRMRSRANAKLGQSQNQSALQNYVAFGPEYIRLTTLTDAQLMGAKSDELLAKVKNLMNYKHRIVYYGPASEKEVAALLNEHHNTPAQLLDTPARVEVPFAPTPTNKVFLAQYDAAQIRYMQISNRGEKFDPANDAELAIYNEYFGGGMNAIVFQEMREARGLAYSSSARLVNPQEKYDTYTFQATIATQNDKMTDAIEAFDEIINEMPESEAAFNVAKSSLISRLRTTRTIKSNVLWAYITAQDQGVDYDRNRNIYEGVQSATLESVKATQQKWVKDRPYHYAILGDIKALDMKKLESLGEVTILTQEEIFGY